MRTGRCIMFLEGHLKSILAVDFSPNGYVVLVKNYYYLSLRSPHKMELQAYVLESTSKFNSESRNAKNGSRPILSVSITMHTVFNANVDRNISVMRERTLLFFLILLQTKFT